MTSRSKTTAVTGGLALALAALLAAAPLGASAQAQHFGTFGFGGESLTQGLTGFNHHPGGHGFNRTGFGHRPRHFGGFSRHPNRFGRFNGGFGRFGGHPRRFGGGFHGGLRFGPFGAGAGFGQRPGFFYR